MCIRDRNNPVRLIRAYVYSLPMEELGFVRAVPAGTGRPGYDPVSYTHLDVYKRQVDAMALDAEERRGKLRKATGSRKQALIRGCLNGGTRRE